MSEVWHYAVWRGSSSGFMAPACDYPADADRKALHHITIARGDVDCRKCLHAMGSHANAESGETHE